VASRTVHVAPKAGELTINVEMRPAESHAERRKDTDRIRPLYSCRLKSPASVYNSLMSTTKVAISTPNAPAAIGPYSQAIRLGELLYSSGQVALDPATGQMVSGGVEEQTVRVLENLKAVLEAAGTGLGQVIKTTVFLKSMNDFAAMNAIYAKYLAPEGAVPPARSTVEVARLPKDALVEIEVIANV
jgi:2-iminobutanoate/2-iminopropanoate deaminase